MPRLSKIGAAALAAFGWTTGGASVTASYLVVAGGAGGGRGTNSGGGGGAGGLRTGTLSLNPALSYTVTVGAGGTGASLTTANGVNGSDSIFSTITSAGGGGGGSAALTGSNGGSGGGGGTQSNSTTYAGGSGNTPSTSPSQGNNGGSGRHVPGSFEGAGGGGGAGAVGNNSSSGTGGAGGAGASSSISGSSVTYAGGGGGAGNTGGAAGSGGGGAGSAGATAGSGTANLGGGGGGGYSAVSGGNGGSGIVIISYAGAQQFGGGVVTSSGGNTIHTFTTSGTLVPVTPLSASYLMVAGGGGGGYDVGGGGGAGGLLSGSSLTIDSNSTYLVTVGAGGSGAASAVNGTNGSNSAFSMVATTAVGGGGGASASNTAGSSGGSGGGGTRTSAAGGSATSGQGNAGGSGSPSSGANISAAGGGGGAGAAGLNASNGVGGNGGVGSTSSISGTSTYYAGGGGGRCDGSGTQGTGGSGGGGTAGSTGTAGTANTGGGGGGGSTGGGGTGGSGVVIISYAGATQQMAGGTVTISGGNVIHTFTSTGYLTPLKYVNNSLRFRSSATAYLNRTPSVASNRRTFTWSGWVKRGTLTTDQRLFDGYSDASNWTTILFEAADRIQIAHRVGGTSTYNLVTTAVYRDPAAWYHIVVAFDTTQATSADRVKLYVNGTQITVFTTNTIGAQNVDTFVDATNVHNIGRYGAASQYFDGYLTEVNLIDGQALTPNSFGTFNSYGVWQPITYGGSYGTNGFYLPFSNTTSTTTLGYDFSPNGNNWTTNNISLTAGATYDSMTDVPTLTSATAANYSVANPLSTLFTVTAGNLDFTYTNSTSGVWYLKGTLAVSSDKYYWEVIPTNVGVGSNISIGIILSTNTQTNTTTINLVTDGYVYHCDGNKYSGAGGATGVAYGATYTNNDVIGVALDLTAGTLVFYKNNVSQGTAFTGLTSSYMQLICNHLGGTSRTVAGSVNAGQRPLTYTPPTGFVALNTFNL